MREQKSGRWSRARCGTVAGYGQHVYWQTEICVYCRAAIREYQREANRRRYWEKKEAARNAA